MKARMLVIALLSICLLLVAACGSSSSPSTSSTPSGEPNETSSTDSRSTSEQQETDASEEAHRLEKTSLIVGSSVRDVGILPLYVADQKGMFREEGLDVTVQYFDGSRPAVQALIAGSIDIGSGAFQEAVDTYISNQPIKAFWGLTNYPIYEWWASPDLQTLDDIKAKGKVKIAVSGIGAPTHLISAYILRQLGFDPETEAEFLALGGPAARLAGLQSGQVDMIPATPPGNFILEREGFNRLILLKDFMDEFQYEVHYAKTELLENNPNTIRAFLRAIAAAGEYIRANPEESADLASEVIGYQPEVRDDVIRAVKEMSDYFPPDGRFAEDGIKMLLEINKENGDIDEIPDHSAIIDYTFTNEFQSN